MQISPARFHQIIKNRIFLKSTRKGQLKNVQDEISRPLGSREIQKTKVETVLVDTLYNRLPHREVEIVHKVHIVKQTQSESLTSIR